MNFRRLMEMFLVESALTKGSQRVMNDKNLVAGIADALRDDSRANPPAFPANFGRQAQKTSDEDLAKWFLENIDAIEKAGYEGTVYSRDGVNNDWIARKYISGAHSWEDITGVMNMNLRDWYLLKNRNLLDANHKDIQKFNGVRDLGHYVTIHYKAQMDKLRDAAKNAARNKMAKNVKLVDNDDYRIYTTLNRAAGCALGLGTQWCTANSASGQFYHSYSNKAMLFQLFPYKKQQDADGKASNVTDEDGKKELSSDEKYQFDAGGPNFMDITDTPVRPAEIAKRFPYLYTDLSTALKQNKEKMEQAFKELSVDPTLQGEDFKIKTYEIDDEIAKLHKFVDRGYFTDEKRPAVKAPAEVHGENPEQPQLAQPAQEPAQMENIRQLAQWMLNEDNTQVGDNPVEEDAVEEDDEMTDTTAAATGGNLGSMGGGAGPSGGGKYPPGTAPTMPESINFRGTPTMEKVDKDVAAMLSSLKKYDKLAESVAPVLMGKKVEEAKDKDEYNFDKDDSYTTGKGGTVTKTKNGLVHKSGGAYTSRGAAKDDKDEKDDEDDKIEEGADPEILKWMGRFAKLGDMKGYGR